MMDVVFEQLLDAEVDWYRDLMIPRLIDVLVDMPWLIDSAIYWSRALSIPRWFDVIVDSCRDWFILWFINAVVDWSHNWMLPRLIRLLSEVGVNREWYPDMIKNSNCQLRSNKLSLFLNRVVSCIYPLKTCVFNKISLDRSMFNSLHRPAIVQWNDSYEKLQLS